MKELPINLSDKFIRLILTRPSGNLKIPITPQPEGNKFPFDRCHYGKSGDKLWVREAFSRSNPGGSDGLWLYRADGKSPWGHKWRGDEVWRSCMHMKKIWSRLTLTINKVDAIKHDGKWQWSIDFDTQINEPDSKNFS